MSDTDLDTDFGSDADYMLPADVAEAAREAQEAASDAKLDKAVRESAVKVFSRPDHDAPLTSDGATIDDTIRATLERIQARPPAPSPPPLKDGASLDDAVEAADEWGRLPKAQQRTMSDAHRELAGLKDAAESFGLELKTPSDLAALRSMLGMDKANGTAEASAPNPVWSSLGLGPDQCKSDAEAFEQLGNAVKFVEQHGAPGWREVLRSFGWSPFDLMSPQEQAALSGAQGGEIGSVVARHAETFRRAGVSPAQGVEYLLAAQAMFERNPEAAIRELARANGVNLGGSEQAMVSLVDAWAQTKAGGVTPEIEQAMLDIMQEPRFAGEGNPLNRLNAAYSEAKRRMGQRSRRSSDEKMHATLKATADEIYGDAA